MLHTETCNLACTDLLMNTDRMRKTRSVWPTLQVKIAHWIKVDVNRHFQTSWASQPMGRLLKLGGLQWSLLVIAIYSIHSFSMIGSC